mmetsp:Transcript_112703/g.318486  ORF Transcript_112703/g.318486 Transcript_112703/m.318486 type:complete len:253 (-) Transcript_112703:802-1560(-)
MHPVHADLCEVITSGAQSNCLRKGGCASLELVRDVSVSGTLEAYLVDHLAAAEEGGRGAQQLRAAPEETHARGTAHLVTAADHPVRTQRLDVDDHVRHTLARINEDPRSHCVRAFHDPLNWIRATEHVGDVAKGHETRAGPNQRLELFSVEHAIGRQARESQFCASLLSDLLPRHQVRVVLHDSQNDFVPRLQLGAGPSPGNDVDGLRGISCEDHFHWVSRTDEVGELRASSFERVSSEDGERVHAAMHVAV